MNSAASQARVNKIVLLVAQIVHENPLAYVLLLPMISAMVRHLATKFES